VTPGEPNNKANTQIQMQQGHGKPAHTTRPRPRPCATSITVSTTLHSTRAPDTKMADRWQLQLQHCSTGTVYSSAYWKTA